MKQTYSTSSGASYQVFSAAKAWVVEDAAGLPKLHSRRAKALSIWVTLALVGAARPGREALCRKNLGVTEEDLHGAQIACLLVDQGCLGASEGVDTVILWTQANCSHSFVNKTGILSSAHMSEPVSTAGEDILIKRASSIARSKSAG